MIRVRTGGPKDRKAGWTKGLRSGGLEHRRDGAPEEQKTRSPERWSTVVPEGHLPVPIACLWHNYAGEFADLQQKTAFRLFSVDPPGLEPGLCGTKIRCVANYTMGQSAPDKALQT
jgi:hypothetical protein